MPKPIIYFDLETTGTDVVNDRIIRLAVMKINSPSDTIEERVIFINPGKPISKEATEAHGITDEMIQDKPKFSQYAKGIFEFITDCDYAGFNIIGFDVPILSEEFARCNLDWPANNAVFYDAYYVFKEKEKRDLSNAVKFYCNELHSDAHDALSDIKATKKVMEAQMQMYEDLCDHEQYAAFCKNPNALDLAGKIVLNENGHAVYNFGKDKGKVVKYHPRFGEWMLSQSFPPNTKNIVRQLINSK